MQEFAANFRKGENAVRCSSFFREETRSAAEVDAEEQAHSAKALRLATAEGELREVPCRLEFPLCM